MIIEGTFIKRKNRFSALVEVDNDEELAYLPNSGRMNELLVAGNRVLLKKVDDQSRKTAYDLEKIYYQGSWVSIDSRQPNKLFETAVRRGQLAEFSAYRLLKMEASWGRSRFDALLEDRSDPSQQMYVELKSVTLVEKKRAFFPDAPTARGRKHLQELTELVEQGKKAAVVFIIQRDDGDSFTPNDRTDPEFGQLLRLAHRAGVEVYAYNCLVDREQLKINQRVEILL